MTKSNTFIHIGLQQSFHKALWQTKSKQETQDMSVILDKEPNNPPDLLSFIPIYKLGLALFFEKLIEHK